MSTEPERPIEKRLRAYAKKRRDQAGAPLELHPATRRLLQGEVARRFKRERGRSFWEGFWQFWPRYAFGIAVIVLAAVAVSLWLPARNKGTMTLAKNEPGNSARTVEELRPSPSAAPALASAQADKRADLSRLRDEDRRQNGNRKLGLEAGQAEAANRRKLYATSEIPTPSPLTPSDGEREKTADSLAGLKEGRAAGPVGAFGGAIAQSKSEAVRQQYGLAGNRPGSLDAPAAAAPPSTFGASIVADAAKPVAGQESQKAQSEAPGEAEFAYKSLKVTPLVPTAPASKDTAPGTLALDSLKTKDSSGSSVHRFRQIETKSAPAKLFYGASAPNSILASFQLERTGDSVRIVDADGSVYSGSVQAPAPSATPVLSAGEKKIPIDREPQLEPKAVRGPAESQARQIYSFRAVGTNLSLKEKVVFTGNVIASANETSFKQTTNGAAGSGVAESPTLPAGPSPLTTLPPGNSRVSGRALIGEGKEVEVNAVPVRP